jgi:hypothetical protein
MQVIVRSGIVAFPSLCVAEDIVFPSCAQCGCVPGGARERMHRGRVVPFGNSEQETLMGIPNESVTENEIEEKRRQEQKEEFREEQRRKAEKSLDRGLEDSFPASDPPAVTQPPPTVHDQKPKR